MQALDVYAGPGAAARIKKQGFTADLFDYVLGASGGPKWFVLAGLDRVVFPEFFANRQKPIDVIGSSAGAFRAACFAQADPLAAINRLAERYSHTVYSDKPDAREISAKGWDLLDYLLGDNGVDQILNNPVVRAHFVVARCKGLARSENKALQMTGLAASASANLVSRKLLGQFFQRYVFSVNPEQIKISDDYGLDSRYVPLARNNLADALMASGSIPVVLEGVRDIKGAPKGMYRDGGIVDYHFDVNLAPKHGLTLYPHFYPKPVPGWFDKSLKSRKPSRDNYNKTVLLVPSEEFVASLPYSKIPDRKDFEDMDAQSRIKYWQTVLAETDRLGEEFIKGVESGSIVDNIKPLVF